MVFGGLGCVCGEAKQRIELCVWELVGDDQPSSWEGRGLPRKGTYYSGTSLLWTHLEL